jgi:hypothetical protein
MTANQTSPSALERRRYGSHRNHTRTQITAVRRLPQRRGEPAFSSDGRVVGAFVRDRDGALWLEKSGLDPDKHRLRQPPSWATETEHLHELRRRGGAGVRLRLTTGETLMASLDDFDRHGIRVERGFGVQIALPVAFWQSYDERRPASEQLALFSA